MQLMPATAKQTAKKAKLKLPSRAQLLTAETNIQIGSLYLKELLERFNGNRILASAAYNAGPHRVDQWLARHTDNLPLDVWIEIIPYKETRHYVQNVLAFSTIYAYRRGEQLPFIRQAEQQQFAGEQSIACAMAEQESSSC